VEVAVTDMTDDRRDEPRFLDVALGLGDALGEPADRHARVGREALGSGPQRARRVVGAVAGSPQAAALALVGRPREVAPAVPRRDRLDLLGLRPDLLGGAVELQEERR